MQGSDEWFKQRGGRFTASLMYNLLMKESTAGYQNYIAQVVAERLTGEWCGSDYVSPEMTRGTELEPQARLLYELQTGKTVTEADFVIHPDFDFIGASPDGYVDDGLVEIKSRNLANHMSMILKEKVDRNGMIQMQTQMLVTGKNWCDYIHYNPQMPADLQLHVMRVDASPVIQDEILTACKKANEQVEEMIEKLTQTK